MNGGAAFGCSRAESGRLWGSLETLWRLSDQPPSVVVAPHRGSVSNGLQRGLPDADRCRARCPARSDRTGPWAEAADPAVVALLDRLLDRIPYRLAEATRLHRLQGLSQPEVARRQGVGQPAVNYRLQTAVERMRWVSTTLPDLVPSEVKDILFRAGEDTRTAKVAGDYWREHRTTACGVPQSTAWHVLFGVKGFVVRRGGDAGVVGEVGRRPWQTDPVADDHLELVASLFSGSRTFPRVMSRGVWSESGGCGQEVSARPSRHGYGNSPGRVLRRRDGSVVHDGRGPPPTASWGPSPEGQVHRRRAKAVLVPLPASLTPLPHNPGSRSGWLRFILTNRSVVYLDDVLAFFIAPGPPEPGWSAAEGLREYFTADGRVRTILLNEGRFANVAPYSLFMPSTVPTEMKPAREEFTHWWWKAALVVTAREHPPFVFQIEVPDVNQVVDHGNEKGILIRQVDTPVVGLGRLGGTDPG